MISFLATFEASAEDYHFYDYELLGYSSECAQSKNSYVGCAVLKLRPSGTKVRIYAGKTRSMTNALVNTLKKMGPSLIRIKKGVTDIKLNNEYKLEFLNSKKGRRSLYEETIYNVVENSCEESRSIIEAAFTVLQITEDKCAKRLSHVVDKRRYEIREVQQRYTENQRNFRRVQVE